MSETSPEQIRHFNLETMSGITPGTRTKRFNILQLARQDEFTAQGAQAIEWAKAFWVEEPPALIVTSHEGEVLVNIDGVVLADETADETDGEALLAEICQALRENNRELVSCGTCAFWRPNISTEAGQPLMGGCRWSTEDEPKKAHLAQELRPQSALALSCPHWQQVTQQSLTHLPDHSEGSPDQYSENYYGEKSSAAPASSTSLPQDFGSEPTTDVDLAVPNKRRPSWMEAVAQRLGFRQRSTPDIAPKAQHLSLSQLDRSGVGAGTEPCLGCNGRIANLGALIVATVEGDKQTFSIWRCRVCAATYLNSWVDRWERLDTLETEESLYRVAPHEALILLNRIHGVVGGDHPQDRENRGEERGWFAAFLHERTPLNHQVRRGR